MSVKARRLNGYISNSIFDSFEVEFNGLRELNVESICIGQYVQSKQNDYSNLR